jgi:hypothetical protein
VLRSRTSRKALKASVAGTLAIIAVLAVAVPAAGMTTPPGGGGSGGPDYQQICWNYGTYVAWQQTSSETTGASFTGTGSEALGGSASIYAYGNCDEAGVSGFQVFALSNFALVAGAGQICENAGPVASGCEPASGPGSATASLEAGDSAAFLYPSSDGSDSNAISVNVAVTGDGLEEVTSMECLAGEVLSGSVVLSDGIIVTDETTGAVQSHQDVLAPSGVVSCSTPGMYASPTVLWTFDGTLVFPVDLTSGNSYVVVFYFGETASATKSGGPAETGGPGQVYSDGLLPVDNDDDILVNQISYAYDY